MKKYVILIFILSVFGCKSVQPLKTDTKIDTEKQSVIDRKIYNYDESGKIESIVIETEKQTENTVIKTSEKFQTSDFKYKFYLIIGIVGFVIGLILFIKLKKFLK